MVYVQELQDPVYGLSILGRSLGILDRQVCGFPSYDAAGNFSDVIKSAALQQAGSDGRPVTARTKNEKGAVSRDLSQVFSQMIEWDA